MTRIKVAAPCKVNLHLSVGERRDDGYHNLESIFQALDFGDTLDVEVAGEDGSCDILTRSPLGGVQIPREENIVYKAVSLFRARTGFDRGIRVLLEKRVPLGGGLGGGSSDAAATLTALDMLAGTGLPLAALRDMALGLGSDVPFFLAEPPRGALVSPAAGCGGAAWVSGRGEHIVPLETPHPWAVVLVNPGFPSPTGEAFRRLDAWRSNAWRGSALRGNAWPGSTGDRDALIRALSGDPRHWPYRNDFLPAFCDGDGKEAAAYRRIISALRDADFAGLSGAGSTCFGVYKDGGAAEKVTKLLQLEWFFVHVTFFLARSAIRVLEC